MNYMREGGFNMWLLLAIAIGTVVLAIVRPRGKRPGIFFGGMVLTLISGILGLATGMEAVSANFGRFEDPAAAIGQGLGELANNGTFSVLIALALGAAHLVTRRLTPAS